MTLVFWTAAGADVIRKTIGQTLKGMRPDTPEHRFEGINGDVVVPAAGEIVMVCGNKPLDLLKAAALLPKNRTLNSMREKPFKPKADGGVYMVTFDPQVVNSEPEKRAIIDWDIRLAHRLLTTGSLQPKLGEYTWVNSFAHLIKRIEARYAQTGTPVDVSCDTETMGLHPWYPDKDIIAVGFTADAGEAEWLYTGPHEDPVPPDPDADLPGQIAWLLNSPKVKLRGANLKYDLIWIAEKWGIECSNFKFDTCLVGNLLDESRSNSLNLHAKVMTPLGGYDESLNAKHDKSHMENVPLDELLPYAGGDTDATYRVADALREGLLEDGALARFYVNILHPASRAFEKIERRGVLVDQHEFHLLRDDLKTEIAENRKLALSLMPAKLRHKHREKIEAQLAEGKSPLTPAILKDFFFSPTGLGLKPLMVTAKTQEPSTARAHLRMFHSNDNARAMCGALETLGSAEKTLSTFVEGFLKHLRPDGLLHPSYMLHHGDLHDEDDEESGTTTGRLACKEPAFQTLPKKTKWAKRLRKCYPAPPGKTIVVLDYSQGELRVVACIAPEKTMIDAYEQGLDLHAVTGAKLGGYVFADFQKLKETDPVLYSLIRDKAKPANFGLLYGMFPEGFQRYCWAQYGLELTLAEATAMHAAFFELYPGLLNYHDDMRSFVKLHEYVRSPLGRVRHLETIRAWDRQVRSKAERQAINSPVQSALTDMMIWAIAEIDRELPEDKFAVVGMIHDALIAYADIGSVAHYAGQAAQIMSSLPLHKFDWHPQLKFPADGEHGPNLAQLSKLPLAA